jgi:hypothetical protein
MPIAIAVQRNKYEKCPNSEYTSVRSNEVWCKKFENFAAHCIVTCMRDKGGSFYEGKTVDK